VADGYNVAFRGTKKTGGYHGVITWSSFADKESFDKWYTDDIREREEVVDEGISAERCIELVHSTPISCRVAASIQDATGSDGEINREILRLEIANVLLSEVL
jgi:hypothetical protein